MAARNYRKSLGDRGKGYTQRSSHGMKRDLYDHRMQAPVSAPTIHGGQADTRGGVMDLAAENTEASIKRRATALEEGEKPIALRTVTAPLFAASDKGINQTEDGSAFSITTRDAPFNIPQSATNLTASLLKASVPYTWPNYDADETVQVTVEKQKEISIEEGVTPSVDITLSTFAGGDYTVDDDAFVRSPYLGLLEAADDSFQTSYLDTITSGLSDWDNAGGNAVGTSQIVVQQWADKVTTQGSSFTNQIVRTVTASDGSTSDETSLSPDKYAARNYVTGQLSGNFPAICPIDSMRGTFSGGNPVTAFNNSATWKLQFRGLANETSALMEHVSTQSTLGSDTVLGELLLAFRPSARQITAREELLATSLDTSGPTWNTSQLLINYYNKNYLKCESMIGSLISFTNDLWEDQRLTPIPSSPFNALLSAQYGASAVLFPSTYDTYPTQSDRYTPYFTGMANYGVTGDSSSVTINEPRSTNARDEDMDISGTELYDPNKCAVLSIRFVREENDIFIESGFLSEEYFNEDTTSSKEYVSSKIQMAGGAQRVLLSAMGIDSRTGVSGNYNFFDLSTLASTETGSVTPQPIKTIHLGGHCNTKGQGTYPSGKVPVNAADAYGVQVPGNDSEPYHIHEIYTRLGAISKTDQKVFYDMMQEKYTGVYDPNYEAPLLNTLPSTGSVITNKETLVLPIAPGAKVGSMTDYAQIIEKAVNDEVTRKMSVPPVVDIVGAQTQDSSGNFVENINFEYNRDYYSIPSDLSKAIASASANTTDLPSITNKIGDILAAYGIGIPVTYASTGNVRMMMPDEFHIDKDQRYLYIGVTMMTSGSDDPSNSASPPATNVARIQRNVPAMTRDTNVNINTEVQNFINTGTHSDEYITLAKGDSTFADDGHEPTTAGSVSPYGSNSDMKYLSSLNMADSPRSVASHMVLCIDLVKGRICRELQNALQNSWRMGALPSTASNFNQFDYRKMTSTAYAVRNANTPLFNGVVGFPPLFDQYSNTLMENMGIRRIRNIQTFGHSFFEAQDLVGHYVLMTVEMSSDDDGKLALNSDMCGNGTTTSGVSGDNTQRPANIVCLPVILRAQRDLRGILQYDTTHFTQTYLKFIAQHRKFNKSNSAGTATIFQINGPVNFTISPSITGGAKTKIYQYVSGSTTKNNDFYEDFSDLVFADGSEVFRILVSAAKSKLDSPSSGVSDPFYGGGDFQKSLNTNLSTAFDICLNTSSTADEMQTLYNYTVSGGSPTTNVPFIEFSRGPNDTNNNDSTNTSYSNSRASMFLQGHEASCVILDHETQLFALSLCAAPPKVQDASRNTSVISDYFDERRVLEVFKLEGYLSAQPKFDANQYEENERVWYPSALTLSPIPGDNLHRVLPTKTTQESSSNINGNRLTVETDRKYSNSGKPRIERRRGLMTPQLIKVDEETVIIRTPRNFNSSLDSDGKHVMAGRLDCSKTTNWACETLYFGDNSGSDGVSVHAYVRDGMLYVMTSVGNILKFDISTAELLDRVTGVTDVSVNNNLGGPSVRLDNHSGTGGSEYNYLRRLAILSENTQNANQLASFTAVTASEVPTGLSTETIELDCHGFFANLGTYQQVRQLTGLPSNIPFKVTLDYKGALSNAVLNPDAVFDEGFDPTSITAPSALFVNEKPDEFFQHTIDYTSSFVQLAKQMQLFNGGPFLESLTYDINVENGSYDPNSLSQYLSSKLYQANPLLPSNLVLFDLLRSQRKCRIGALVSSNLEYDLPLSVKLDMTGAPEFQSLIGFSPASGDPQFIKVTAQDFRAVSFPPTALVSPYTYSDVLDKPAFANEKSALYIETNFTLGGIDQTGQRSLNLAEVLPNARPGEIITYEAKIPLKVSAYTGLMGESPADLVFRLVDKDRNPVKIGKDNVWSVNVLIEWEQDIDLSRLRSSQTETKYR